MSLLIIARRWLIVWLITFSLRRLIRSDLIGIGIGLLPLVICRLLLCCIRGGARWLLIGSRRLRLAAIRMGWSRRGFHMAVGGS